MRAGNGSVTVVSTIKHQTVNQAIESVARRREGASSICPQKRAAQGRVMGIFGDIAGEQITDQFWIRQFQKLDECRAFFGSGSRMALAQVAQQQEVQFLHAPAAVPLEDPQALARHVGDRRRSGAVRHR